MQHREVPLAPVLVGVDEDTATSNSYVEKVVKQRLQKVREFCAKNIKVNIWENLRPTGQVWSSMKHDIHYCLTPKIGCTYWKRVMRFIAGDYNTNLSISKPRDIDRKYVHYGNMKYIRHVDLQSTMVRGEMSKGRSFMFTREPYGRLWSAYIDKFLLPDFWRTDAQAVINKVRRNATDEQRLCANDVTFAEFLQYIVASYPRKLNEHWQPVYKICDPCLVVYDVIGKQETFANDSNYILQKFGLGYLIPTPVTNLPLGTTQESGYKRTFKETSRQGEDEDTATGSSYVEKVVKQRLQKVRDFCAKNINVDNWENLKPTGEVWSSMKHDIHYCVTPKIGCTYWKQVMRFIAGDYNTNLSISKPRDIDRNYVHFESLKYIRHGGLESAMTRGEMSKGHSFMFTREPYSRLWSAYVDKFLLPDFWRFKIVKGD
ncbi:CHSTE-like protein [Mya arenaria]|uniref:Carbohydrate sulfotransferase n=1 Tax=Mya arenaria TaxID=6604 RepID=A0ABY7DW96_MYAAR|nr:CHSTE-like protein [Mya arenaria]